MNTANFSTPNQEYERRLTAHRNAIALLETRSQQFWQWRRWVFVTGLAMIGLGFAGWLNAGWLMLPLIVFLTLIVRHQGVFKAQERLKRAAQFYEYGLARMDEHELAWAGRGNTGERFADLLHPYAEDLDLFGRGSIFELLCTARTRAGEERLARWLLAPAKDEEIQARQQAVAELRTRLTLREDLALLGDDVQNTRIHHTELATWGAAPPLLVGGSGQLLAALLGGLSVIALVLWAVYGWRHVAFGALILESVYLMRMRHVVAQSISAVEHPSRDLKLLTHLLARFEQESFTSPRLVQLGKALETHGVPPSQQIARLEKWCERLDWTKNQFVTPVAVVLLLHVHIAYAIERWRAECGPQIAQWLDALAELEALNSLAGYAYERPADPFPEIVTGLPCFIAEELGHPLIPAARRIRNSLKLSAQQQLLIISGSNMSGKSTLMRTVGVNIVLALAGAPVSAQALRLTRLQVGASIHILDSLQAGASRFYAEIKRLRQVVELTEKELPLLFLLDEILSGTNSHDRAIGASAVVKGLVERGALGLVTTHDLALTRIADELGTRAINVHFEDELKDGRMSFDYQMRPGVVERSNALELMRAVGLNV